MSDNTLDKDHPDKARFHYVKANFFRVAHVDGVIGGLTPQGSIHMSTYSERPALPQVMEYSLVDGRLGEGQIVESKVGYVREMDVDLMMSSAVARDIAKWLTSRADELDRLVEDAEASQARANP